MESLVYTANQVAELFQISISAVYDLRNKGKLKKEIKKITRQMLVIVGNEL